MLPLPLIVQCKEQLPNSPMYMERWSREIVQPSMKRQILSRSQGVMRLTLKASPSLLKSISAEVSQAIEKEVEGVHSPITVNAAVEPPIAYVRTILPDRPRKQSKIEELADLSRLS